jgi:hypothetical protein
LPFKCNLQRYNEVEAGIVTASNDKAGTWTFDVRGKGTVGRCTS